MFSSVASSKIKFVTDAIDLFKTLYTLNIINFGPLLVN